MMSNGDKHVTKSEGRKDKSEGRWYYFAVRNQQHY